MKRLIFLLHVCSAFFMFGFIWFVQIVHYPLLSYVGETTFIPYEWRSIQLSTFAATVPMLVEFITGVLVLWGRPNTVSERTVRWNFSLLIVTWLVTFAIQVPAHIWLSRGFVPATHTLLVWSNWAATILWAFRSGLLFLALRSAWAASAE